MQQIKRGDKMVNVDKLIGALFSKGYNKGSFAEALGKRQSWLSGKLKKKNFTLEEADEIVRVLKLDAKEATEIFFSQFIA